MVYHSRNIKNYYVEVKVYISSISVAKCRFWIFFFKESASINVARITSIVLIYVAFFAAITCYIKKSVFIGFFRCFLHFFGRFVRKITFLSRACRAPSLRHIILYAYSFMMITSLDRSEQPVAAFCGSSIYIMYYIIVGIYIFYV